MPNQDGTGPAGLGPKTGRMGNQGNRRGTKLCVCPKCGYEQGNARGIPCTQMNCPKCDAPMNGNGCLQK